MVSQIISNLTYTPNHQQSLVIEALARFCAPLAAARTASGTTPAGPSADCAFILAGYAGTGKSSLTGALVKALDALGIPTVLMAPTGRAAKVFSAYAGHPAYTIHRKIYRHSISGETPGLQQNNASDTLYIVDEASMISADYTPSGSSLLEDLIQYVFAGGNNRLILLGDTAQLPPVGSESSPAMEPDVLRSFGLRISRATLTAVARQDHNSGVLYNATQLRRALAAGDVATLPEIVTSGFSDISTVLPEDLPEALETAYRRDGIDQTLLITRSNQRATDFNLAIRAQILYLENKIERGEQILIAKNNYFYSRRVKNLDFIANGDIAVVSKVYSTEHRYGLQFADVQLTLTDRPVTFDAKVFLTTLTTPTPALSSQQLQELYQNILLDADTFAPETPMPDRIASLRTNPYWNALQVKFAYAVTCHKAQGGQWRNIFVDMGYIHPESASTDLYRWLYTAITRATGSLTILQ